VTVIDGATDSVLATVPTGDEPRALCYDPQNNKVYCANNSGASVTVIDGVHDSVVTTISVGAGPIAFAWNPVQNRVYVANSEGSSISVLRDSGGGVEEAPNAKVRTRNAATVVRGVLNLGVDSGQYSAFRADLLDATGRRFAVLHRGANDVSHLAPGVYFIREERAESREQSTTSVRKVVVTR
jgi:YVTN family beta-propeller protein